MELSTNRETPIDISLLVAIADKNLKRPPESEYQAIMEAGVGDEPAPVSDGMEPLRVAVVDCIDMLSDQDKFIIEAVHYEQVTYEELGYRLGVSNVHAWRLAKSALDNLKQLLEMHETIREYLGRDEELEQWDEKTAADGKNSLTPKKLEKSKTN